MCPISTGLAVALVVGSSAATAATTVYGQRKAGKLNEKAIDAQSKSEEATRQMQLTSQREGEVAAAAQQAELLKVQREQLAQTEQARRDELLYKQQSRDTAISLDKQRYDAYVAANTPYWNKGSQVLDSLMGLATGRPGAGTAGASALASVPTSLGGGGPLPMGTPSQSAGAPSPQAARSPASVMDLARAASPGVATAPSSRVSAAPPGQPFPRMQIPAAVNGMTLMDLIKLASSGAFDQPTSASTP